MSGGVDSRGRAAARRPRAIGVTLRLWTDPEGSDSERACCSPAAVIAARDALPLARPPARHARPARGVPARGRRAVRPRLRPRRDAEPVHALQRRLPLRRAARVRAARGSGAARDRPLRAHRRAPRPSADRARGRRGQGSVVHARPARSGACSSASGSRSASGGRRRRAPRRPPPGSPRRQRPESQEACFLAGDDYRAVPASGGGSSRRPGRSSTRVGRRLGDARRALALHARPAARARRRRRAAAVRDPHRRGDEHGRRRPARGARADVAERRGRLYVPVDRAEVKVRYRSPAVRRDGRARPRRVPARARRARRTASPPGQTAVLYEDDVVVGAGLPVARLRSADDRVRPLG